MRPALLLWCAGLLCGAEPGVDAQPAPPVLWASFPGRIDNRAQLGYAPPMSWLNLAWVAPEGARVAPGDPLLRIDTRWLKERWITDSVLQRDERAAQFRSFLADSAGRLADLEKRRADLEEQLPALRSALADAAHRDEAVIAQARLRRDRTADHAARLAGQATAAEALVAAGRLPAVEADLARAEARQAALVAAAAARQLALAEDPDPVIGAATAQLRIERLEAQIGDAEHGLVAEIAAASAKETADLAAGREHLNREELNIARLEALCADPELRAGSAGRVRLRNGQVQGGAKLPATAAVFVCGTGEQVAAFGLPEHLRDLVRPWTPGDESAGLAEVDVQGAAGPQRLTGRLLSIGATPEPQPDGRRAFPAVIGLGAAGDELPLGLPATVRLAIQTTADSLTLPAFCLGWSGRPMVLTGDGARPVEAAIIGSEALILSGLAAGTRVLPWEARTAIRVPTRRLTGVLEAWERDPVRLRATDWEVSEIVPDGSLVEAGAVVARLSPYWRDFWAIRQEVLASRTNARHRRNSAAAGAAIERLRAEVDRRRAALDAKLAQLELAEAEKPRAIQEIAQAEAAALGAAARAHRAAAAVPKPGESRADLSEGARTALAAEAERAAIDAERAALDAVALRRQDSWVDRRAAEERLRSARWRGECAEADWQLARTVFLRQIANVAQVYRMHLRSARNQRRLLEGEVLLAPRSGRIHHRPGKPLRIGSVIDDLEPLYVPLGPARRLQLEIPAEAAVRFPRGSVVPVAIPALGREPRSARVIASGTRFGPPAGALGDGAAGEQVTDLILRLDLDPADADRAGPGMTAHVDL